MSTHWLYVALSWGASLGLFGLLAGLVMVRYRNARRMLARLEPRK